MKKEIKNKDSDIESTKVEKTYLEEMIVALQAEFKVSQISILFQGFSKP